MAVGLAVFNCMPTSLSTSVTLTAIANGNTSVALLLVVLTNLLAVFSIPPMLSLVLGAGAAGAASFQPVALFRNLVATVLLPLLAGAAVQAFVPGVQDWRTRNRPLLSYLSALCLCTVPWMQVSKAVQARLPLGPATLASAAAAGLGLHLALLAANSLVLPLIRFNRDGAQGVVLCGASSSASARPPSACGAACCRISNLVFGMRQQSQPPSGQLLHSRREVVSVCRFHPTMATCWPPPTPCLQTWPSARRSCSAPARRPCLWQWRF